MFTRRALAAVTVGAMVSMAGSVAHAAGTIDITDPADGAALTDDSVMVRGTVGVGDDSSSARTVTYLVDVSSSTGSPRNLDCNGDGALDPDDDFNSDSREGDVLDCEIASVQALNHSLSGTTGLSVGVAAFGSSAAYADLGTGQFAAPGATDDSGSNRVRVVTNSLKQGRIDQYTAVTGIGTGTSFNNALTTVVDAYASVAGEKWVFMISDGEASVSTATLTALQESGIRVRTFAVGSAAACGEGTALTRIATTTGEICTAVADPTDLRAVLSGASGQVDSVSVELTGPEGYSRTVDVTGSVDALGDWESPEFTDLADGSYEATVSASFTDGTTAVDSVTFIVEAVAAVEPTPTSTPTRTATPTFTPTRTVTPTPTPSPHPSASARPSASAKPSHSPSAKPSHSHSVKPSHSHPVKPSSSPSTKPLPSPSGKSSYSQAPRPSSSPGGHSKGPRKYHQKDQRGGLAKTGSN